MKTEKYIFLLLRLAMGFLFFWAFIDKLFGLSFATQPDKSWIKGVSPTYGFLKFGVHGPLQQLFSQLAGNSIIDWLFMGGLLFVGLALLLGICVKLASILGSILLLLIYLSLFPTTNNPILDEHIVYILVLLLLGYSQTEPILSMRKWWKKMSLVKKYQILQ